MVSNGMLLVVSLLAVTCVAVTSATTCNEAQCASLVTKCMLLKSCECDMSDKKNCPCCKDCHRCLSQLYTECCSCVGMCSEGDGGLDSRRTSTVDTLPGSIPDLFEILTSEPDDQRRWTTFTYSAHFDLLGFSNEELDHLKERAEERHRIRHQGHHGRVDIDLTSSSMNCTVAYWSKCMGLNRCSTSCSSMGASSYRWFHEYGCCQCIGPSCLNFGNSEAMCAQCPPREGDMEEEDEDAFEVMYEAEMNPTDANHMHGAADASPKHDGVGGL